MQYESVLYGLLFYIRTLARISSYCTGRPPFRRDILFDLRLS